MFPMEKSVLCQRCSVKLHLLEGALCAGCGRELTNLKEDYYEGDRCMDCISWEKNPEWRGVLVQNRSLCLYDDWMREVMVLYKFRGDCQLAEIFRFKWQQAYKRYYAQYDMIVPIPLSAERLYERGFNQSMVLANMLQRPVYDLLARRHHEKQSKKTKKERLETGQFFFLKDKVDLQGKKVLLIDDIYTTGTTIRYAAKALKEKGTASISSLTLARG
jgi:competence protein ComFC